MMRMRVGLMLLVASALLLLPTIAYTTPPDQTWLGGLYDDGDYDDVVVLATAGVGITDTHLPDEGKLHQSSVTLIPISGDRVLPSARIATRHTRAPPSL